MPFKLRSSKEETMTSTRATVEDKTLRFSRKIYEESSRKKIVIEIEVVICDQKEE